MMLCFDGMIQTDNHLIHVRYSYGRWYHLFSPHVQLCSPQAVAAGHFAQLVLPAEQHCWHDLQLQLWLHPAGPARTAQKPSELTRQLPVLTQEADSER